MRDIETNIVVNNKIDSSINRDLKTIGDSANIVSTAINKLSTNLNKVDFSKLKGVTGQLNSMLAQLQNTLANTGTGVSNLGNSHNNTVRHLAAFRRAVQGNSDELRQLNQTLQQASNATANFGNNARGATGGLNSLNSSLNGVEASGRRVNNSLKRAEQSFSSFGGSVARTMSVLAGFTGVSLSVSAIASSIDGFQRVSNKLQMTAESASEVKLRMEQLRQVALASYSAPEELAQLYTRLNLAFGQMGLGADQAMHSTEILAKTVALAGLTTSEASSSLLQISQAFNKGKLDGDEFRNVMETMPPLADAIARRLGVMRSELLELAPKGVITSRVLAEAIEEMGDRIDSKFNKLVPTMQMGFQNLTTQMGYAVGRFNEAIGLSKGLGAALAFAAEHADVLVGALAGLGAGAALKGLLLLRKPLGDMFSMFVKLTSYTNIATGAMKTFSFTMSRMPIIGWVAALGALIPIIDDLSGNKLSEFFGLTSGATEKFQAEMARVNGEVSKFTSKQLIENLKLSETGLTEASDKINKYKTKVEELRKEQERLANAPRLEKIFDYDGFAGLTVWTGKYKDNLKELEQVNKKLADAQLDLAEAEQERLDLFKNQTWAIQEVKKRIQEYEAALAKATDEEKRTNPALIRMQNELSGLKTWLENAEGGVWDLQSALKALGATSVAPMVQSAMELASKAVNGAIAKKQAEVLNADMDDIKKKIRTEILSGSKENKAIQKREEHIQKAAGNKYGTLTPEQRKEAEQAAKAAEEELKKLDDAYDLKHGKGKKGKGGGSKKKELTEQEKDLKSAKESYEKFNLELQKEHELLGMGVEAYNKYKSMYSMVIDAKVKGLQITDDEIKKMKEQIDLNDKLRERMEYIKQFQDNAPSKKQEQWKTQFQALQDSGLEGADYSSGVNTLMQNMGLETDGMTTYYDEMFAKAKDTIGNINTLYQDGAIGFSDYIAGNAQVIAKTYDNTVATTRNSLSQLAALQNSENKRIARIGKAAAIANATIGAISMSINAYSSAAAIPYVGWIMAPIAAGVALAAGMAQVAQIRSQPTGYKMGGFTGFQGMDTVAGQVHGNEYVFDAKSTRNHGVENLEALRNGTAEIVRHGERTGGDVNVNIENYGTNKDFSVERVSEDTIRIIARDVVQSEGESIVKSYLNSNDGQSQVSRIAKRNS